MQRNIPEEPQPIYTAEESEIVHVAELHWIEFLVSYPLKCLILHKIQNIFTENQCKTFVPFTSKDSREFVLAGFPGTMLQDLLNSLYSTQVLNSL